MGSDVQNAPNQLCYKKSCVTCGGDVWLSQSGQERLKKEPTSKTMCIKCMVKQPPATSRVELPTLDTMIRDLGDKDQAVRLYYGFVRPLLRMSAKAKAAKN